MRNVLYTLLILLFITACKEEDTPSPKTRYDIEVRKQIKDSAGKVTAKPTLALIYMWPSEGRDFDVSASGSDVYAGAVYDKNSGTLVTAKYGAVGAVMNEEVEPGKYFVYVTLPKSSEQSSLVHSYTYFELKEGETLEVRKTFGYSLTPGQFEEWGKNN